MLTPNHNEPFGQFGLSPYESRVIALSRAMPEGWLGKRLALWLRKLAKGAMTRPVDIEVFGKKMRLDGSKNIAERRLLIQPQHFDPAERAALAAHLRPGDVAVDIGANIGAYTLVMAGLVGRDGRTIAIEPQPSVAARLKVNLSFNPELNVELVETALGDHEGTVAFELSAKNEGEGRISATAGGADKIRVPLTTLHALLAQLRVSSVRALKIDIEGGEPQVLIPFFEVAPKSQWPSMMILEQNDNRWALDLGGFLRAKGYETVATTKLNTILRRT